VLGSGALGIQALLVSSSSAESTDLHFAREAQLLQRLFGLGSALGLRWWWHEHRCGAAIAPIDLHVEPARDVEELGQTLERELTRDRPSRVSRVVACLANRVELVLNDLGHRQPERLGVREVVEIVRERRPEPVRS
jgi:hypothetical protein